MMDATRSRIISTERKALADAAQSLESISEQAGQSEYMDDMIGVRAYARSRALVVRAALAQRADEPVALTDEEMADCGLLSELAPAAPAYVPLAIIGKLLDDAMSQAVANGANSISMPDEYVALAAWLAEIPPKPPVLSNAQIDALMPEADFDGLTIDDEIEEQRRMWYADSLRKFARAIESLVVARMKGTP